MAVCVSVCGLVGVGERGKRSEVSLRYDAHDDWHGFIVARTFLYIIYLCFLTGQKESPKRVYVCTVGVKVLMVYMCVQVVKRKVKIYAIMSISDGFCFNHV